MRTNRAVFFDRDGTLIPNIPYNCDPAAVRLSPGAGQALRSLAAAGYELFVVSNQSGVARGFFPEEALAAMTVRLEGLVAAEGAALAGVYYCVHHPEAAVQAYRSFCGCRKPAAGMLEQAARDHGLDLEQCWMVGDILDDVEAGRAAGARSILIDNGNETEWILSAGRLPHHIVRDLREAAAVVLSVGSAAEEFEVAA